MSLKLQFRISDLIVGMVIIGSFPLALEYLIGTPTPAGRAALLFFGAGIECGALVWGSEISNTFKIENFFARGAIQLYSFVSLIALMVSTILWMMTVVVITSFILLPSKAEKPSEQFILCLIISTVIVASMYIVQCKRVDLERRNSSNREPM